MTKISLTDGALFVAVVVGSVALATEELLPGKIYQFVSSTNCFIKQGTGAQTAAAAAGNIFCPLGTPFYIHGSNGDSLSVIRNSADGVATLHLVTEI